MQTPLDQALLVLLVGMFSVFLILGLIVLSGQFLIRVVNRFFPVIANKVTSLSTQSPQPNTTDLRSLAALTAAVEAFTNGKGRIVSIEKTEE